MITALIAIMTLCPAYDLVAADAITVEQVIGPEFPGAYKHPASFDILENGDIYLAYYGGGGEYVDDSCVWGMRKPKDTGSWTTPVVIADTPFLSEGNPVVWQAPDGLVWLFYVQRYGETWSESRIKAKISRDGAQTWSDSMMVAWEPGMMVRSHPIVLANGQYLLPIYHETGGDREEVGDDTASLFLFFDPATKTWSESGRIRSRTGNLQASVVALSDSHLVAYCRRGGGYEPCDDCYIVRAESLDGGRTWSRGEDSPFPNPNSAIDFIKLASGNLLLVYNDSMDERTPLTVAISTDNDATYAHRKNIGEGNTTFAYPVARQAPDGKIHVVYTTQGRTVIMHAVFEEEAILD